MISEEQKKNIDNQNIKDIIEMAMDFQERSKEMYDQLKYMKFVLTRYMKQQGASIIAHSDIECKGKKDDTSWDYGKLSHVRELLDPSDIKLFYFPEHEEVTIIKEKYDMRVGNGFKKYGGEVKSAIESATVEGDIRDVLLKRKG